ncbi:hypothetical protein [Cellulomonas oligotrophica]|uniref:Uncharacterized protein n=1 Tax=Cellulomonas oligotrophica TaxID=931536 RepID=A0A7Y9JWL3_9CELL|nr:hypothetical protein [Cellulomonas oligotrophica]NYD85788.1 hypothetical protein [Cellulomonas oligotrophica]GIG31206.1 hypothetical protein Col01nite_03650 [Cellulomonas oligotrophica]
MTSRLPVDRGAYLRLRRRARLLTVAAVLPLALGAANVVAAALSDDPTVHRLGAWWFFQSALWLIGAGWVVQRAWRRSRAAQPHVQQLGDLGAARPSDEALGVPGLSTPAPPHLGLSGQVRPSPRW